MAVYRVWWHMSADMPKIARHFATINEASLRRERETDGTYDYKITVTIGLDYNTMPPTETESCHFLAYKGMYSIIRSLFSFKVYIALNYGGSNHQPAHVIRAPITSKYI